MIDSKLCIVCSPLLPTSSFRLAMPTPQLYYGARGRGQNPLASLQRMVQRSSAQSSVMRTPLKARDLTEVPVVPNFELMQVPVVRQSFPYQSLLIRQGRSPFRVSGQTWFGSLALLLAESVLEQP